MAWPWHFPGDLSPAQKEARRHALDWYAAAAQLSALLPVVLFLLVRAGIYAQRRLGGSRGSYDAVPQSAELRSHRLGGPSAGTTTSREARLRMLGWWMGDDMVILGWTAGPRGVWIAASAWACWLVTLCVVGTGTDYAHVTKRFGIVAVSQIPLQYLLALKSLNPIAWVFRSSHEEINKYHRALGRVIYLLLFLHATFYLNLFVGIGIFPARLFHPVVIAGSVSFILVTAMYLSAIDVVRHWSYRVFFLTHLAGAFAVPAIIMFHAKPARIYMAEALLCLLADLASRKALWTTTARAALELIPGTNLVKITASLPHRRLAIFKQRPGSHVYVNIPGAMRPGAPFVSAGYWFFELLYNPLTVASIDADAGEITLVARALRGPVSRRLVELSGRGTRDVTLAVEGPYGAAAKNFARTIGGEGSVDRVLVVAGGVGGTFAVPVYRAVRAEHPSAKVELVWAVRDAGDATWPSSSGGRDNESLLADSDVHLYLTGDLLGTSRDESSSRHGASGDVLELRNLSRDRRRNRSTGGGARKRPDFHKLVDDLFRHGSEERVAVLVCGPAAMARQLREAVRPWVMRGRIVTWHCENFDW